MCVPISPDYVPTLPNNFQVLPPSPEFGFDFINAFVSDDEEEPFEVLTDEEEEEPMPTNFASNTSNCVVLKGLSFNLYKYQRLQNEVPDGSMYTNYIR